MKFQTWWTGEAGDSAPRTLVVFLHGFFSGHDTFSRMKRGLRERLAVDTSGRLWAIAYGDYDYFQDLAKTAAELDSALARATAAQDRVIFVCHSLGGLLARATLLMGRTAPERVARVILLGTPNHGAMRTAQLALLAQLLVGAGAGLAGIFLRKPSLRQVTDVDRLFAPWIDSGAERLSEVEYVTLPGTFFHEGRKAWDLGERGEAGAWKAAFALLAVGSELAGALLPLWSIRLSRPHDGIVEGASTNLIPADSGRWSEKSAAINHPGRFAQPTYAHLQPRACDELTHVTIHQDDRVISLVADLIVAENLRAWYQALPPSTLASLKVEMPGVV